jgi:hypothetical protein
MGTVRSWRETAKSWREHGAAGRKVVQDARPAAQPAELEEFDWESLRRVWEDEPAESHQVRAEQSLRLVNQVLASRRRNRRLLQVASVLLAPLAIFLALRGLRQAFA